MASPLTFAQVREVKALLIEIEVLKLQREAFAKRAQAEVYAVRKKLKSTGLSASTISNIKLGRRRNKV